MKRNEIMELIGKEVIDKKIVEERFSGVMHIDIHCGKGGIREVQIQPEPERLKYVHAAPPDPLSGRAYREG